MDDTRELPGCKWLCGESSNSVVLDESTLLSPWEFKNLPCPIASSTPSKPMACDDFHSFSTGVGALIDPEQLGQDGCKKIVDMFEKEFSFTEEIPFKLLGKEARKIRLKKIARKE
ncbi:hypothetical protein HPP92_018893 [Vanilla planifolia]|uniref:Uncharacterized protein n=1 Tax=Vanilla planifolia TaxID=51239 RepID=A0A835Q7Z6_VANPL|nr:hypothetical protein HPP92_018893 [Vanilla planifolia]